MMSNDSHLLLLTGWRCLEDMKKNWPNNTLHHCNIGILDMNKNYAFLPKKMHEIVMRVHTSSVCSSRMIILEAIPSVLETQIYSTSLTRNGGAIFNLDNSAMLASFPPVITNWHMLSISDIWLPGPLPNIATRVTSLSRAETSHKTIHELLPKLQVLKFFSICNMQFIVNHIAVDNSCVQHIEE